MTDADRIDRPHRFDPRRFVRARSRMAARRGPTSKPARVITTLSLLAVATSCYAHPRYDPLEQVAAAPRQGEVRVVTVRGEVYMLRMAAVHGDTLAGDRISCKPGWGYDEGWCKGVRRFPADSSRIAIPVADIAEARTRSFSASRTIPVAVGIAAGLAMVILLAIGASEGLSTY